MPCIHHTTGRMFNKINKNKVTEIKPIIIKCQILDSVHLEFQEFPLLPHQVNSFSNQTTPLLKFKAETNLIDVDDYDSIKLMTVAAVL